MREAYEIVMRVLTEDHPALLASGGRLLSRLSRLSSRLTSAFNQCRGAPPPRLSLRDSLRSHCARAEGSAARERALERASKALGIALLGVCALAYLDMWIYQGAASLTLGLERLHSARSARSAPRIQYTEGQSMGWIEIPRLGVSAVVAHGDDVRTLRRSVGHIPGTAFPGEGGNVGLAGHRDTFFHALGEIRTSDLIRLVMPQAVYAYRVEDVGIVRPQRRDVLDPTPISTLTLVTCYPFEYIGSAPYRYIIRARELQGAGETR